MSKVVKSIKSVVKKIAKPLAIAAAIYFGGAALGFWSSPFSAVNGALVKGGSTAAAGSGAAAGTANTAAITNAVNSTMGVTTAGAGSGAATGSGIIKTAAALKAAPAGIPSITVTGSQAAAPLTAAKVGTAAGTAAGANAMNTAYTAPSIGATTPTMESLVQTGVNAGTQSTGIISRMMNGVGTAGNWAKANPLQASMLVSGAASMLSPDEIDVMREQEAILERRRDEERRLQEENLSVGQLQTPVYRQQPLKYLSTGQPVFSNGIINSRRTA